MKISNFFPTEFDVIEDIKIEGKHIVVDGKRHKGMPLYSDGKLAMIHAINNHDALVSMLEKFDSVVDLWLPHTVDDDHKHEAECLHALRGEMLTVLANVKGESNE